MRHHGAMKRRPVAFRPPGADYEIRVVGDRATPLRDFYHALLQLPWWATIAAISVAFLVTNALFAFGYLLVGGVSHATPQSFRDAFFFSVLTAVSTGLVFAKFSRPTAQFVFSRRAVIAPVNGVPTLMFRLGNQRGNQIVNAQITLVLVRTERTNEGETFYRMLDLKPSRERALSLSRSWNVLHAIDDASPLAGETPASVLEKEVEVQVMVIGVDDVSMQTVHAAHRYFAKDIVWGARMADVLTETPDGHLQLDLSRFHDVEP